MADRRAVTWPDLALTAALLLVGLKGTGPAAANQGVTVPVAGYVLVAAACLPIVLWRWRPLWALVGSGAATALYLGLGYAYGPIMFPLVVAVYGYAVQAVVRRTVIATGVLAGAAGVALAAEVAAGDRGWAEFLTGVAWTIAWLIIPAAAGVVVKVRRDAAAEVRAEQARRGVSEERLRLAQEVHDVVGHSLAVIAMQAGVVLRVLDRDPDRARQAVETIRSTSTEALDSLRVELDSLRRASPPAEVPRRPGTGLADLPDLVARFRDSGLPVSVEDAGVGPGNLPADVDHAAYRVVQEALTNVLRHGGPQASARTRITRDGDAVQVEVTNTGVRPPPGAGGHGITGMRERARALGGVLEAGPQPAGGFAVRARLPLTGDHRQEGGA
jgi:signal transduction histidine kinase